MGSSYWREWAKAALVRAIRTFAQTAAALIGAGAISVLDVEWPQVLGVSATAAVASVLTSLAGLPEVAGEVPGLLDGEVMDDGDGK